MQTRRDQLHAYKFLVKRAQASLVAGEPNLVDPPMRRLTVTTVSGVMVAVLVAVGFAIFGFVKPSVGDSWKQTGSIIVERETGARYVYIDGKLHPALNYASAVLAVSASAGSSVSVVLVDRSDLKGVPRGAVVGSPGLPDELPSSGKLVRTPWIFCSDLTYANPDDQTGAISAKTTLHIGTSASATPLPANDSLYVQTPGGAQRFLVYNGIRHGIPSDTVANLLGLTGQPLTVATAVVNALPVGSKLTAPALDGRGQPGVTVGGRATQVGDVVVDAGRPFLVTIDGLAAVTPVEQALFESAGGREIPVPAGSSVQAKAARGQTFTVGLPAQLPQLSPQAENGSGVCATFADLAHPSMGYLTTVSVPPGQKAGESTASLNDAADTVDLQAGGAAFVTTTKGAQLGYIVAFPGRTFALNSNDVATAFGYGSTTPSLVTTALLKLIPAGPPLTTASANLQPR